MGFGNLGTGHIAPGERRLVQRLASIGELTVFDVGAYQGDYSISVRAFCSDAKVWSFEPHPETYKRLKEASDRSDFLAFNLAMSDAPGKLPLHDYASIAHTSGSAHASLQAGVVDRLHGAQVADVDVEVTTVDAFMTAMGIGHLSLLKIDAEGYELAILRGAHHAIDSGQVNVVQYEFNEMNVMSRVFFKDFYDALPRFSFYRMLTDGLVPIGHYRPRTHELFFLQNVVAIRDRFEGRTNFDLLGLRAGAMGSLRVWFERAATVAPLRLPVA